MASFYLLSPLFFLLPLFLPATPTSPPPPPTYPPSSLLGFNCSSSSPSFLGEGSQLVKQSALKALLQNLTETDSSISYGGELPLLHTFLQCRPGLSTTQCAHCGQKAVEAMGILCSSSVWVSVWFEDCYIYYSYNRTSSAHSCFPVQVFAFRSNLTDDHALDLRRFDLALNTLLPQLRAETRVAVRRGFSSGDIAYGDGRRIFAWMECLRFLTPEACDSCLAAAVARSRRCCGGAVGVTVVEGSCVLRFETYRFFSVAGGLSGSGSGERMAAVYEESESAKGGTAPRRTMVLWVWCACFVCVMGVTLGCWVLRRRVAFTSKVGSLPVEPTK